jgi:uncharacterized membrane protein
MANNAVIQVSYGESITEPAAYGKVLVGIINREQENTSYSLVLTINGQPIEILLNGQKISGIDSLTLAHGEKWEEGLGFAPVNIGQNQKVEFILNKNGEATPYLKLHFWINVSEQS